MMNTITIRFAAYHTKQFAYTVYKTHLCTRKRITWNWQWNHYFETSGSKYNCLLVP